MRAEKLLTFVLALVVAVGAVYATPVGGATGTLTDQGSFPTTAPTSLTVTAGNIYTTTLSSNQSTDKWAGIAGNASALLKLADSNSKAFFEWTANVKLVYFAEATITDWTTLTAATSTDVTSAHANLGTTASDNYANTFTGSCTVPTDLASITSDCANPLPAASGFETYALKADTSTLVWGSKIISGGATGWDGNTTVDFEAIVPAGTFYVYLEL